MKKLLIILLALILASGFAFAQDKASTVKLTPMVDKGELLANVGIGWGGLSGGVEYTFARIDIGGILPLTFGAAGRALVDPGIFYSGWSTFAFGVGGFGTAHVGFKDIELPSGLTWLRNFDAYAGIGLGFGSATSVYDSYEMKPGISFSTFEGVSYYLNDKLAINFEYGYIGSVKYEYDWFGYVYSYKYPLWYSTIGVVLKL
jgi:opacity protein-like surface antigen